MPSHVIEVEFKGNRREFYLWETDELPSLNAAVIVEVDRGEDLGRVHSTGDLAIKRNKGTPHGTGEKPPERKARRLASQSDLRRLDDLRRQGDEARRKAQERVKANSLVMKISDAEWQWDRKKLTFYFTAEKRVDFRTLVRELAAAFRTRIELKQIGVRDEAKRLDGIGRCGRQYCSASWLPELRPVSLGVAKDQKLSLNPTQISGACGRLMCSLRYEHEYYVQARRRFPKEGKIVKTATGEEKVIANDIFRERVTLRSTEGESRIIPLAQFRQETGAPADAGPSLAVESEETRIDEGVSEEMEAASREDSVRDVVTADHVELTPQAMSAVPAPSTPAQKPQSRQQEKPQEQQGQQQDGERRHRRRGRRGGRRNRGRRGGGGGGGGNAPPSGAPS